jgi:7-cyano-7-deazaguanine synthase
VEEKTAQPVEPEQAAPVTEVEKNPIKAKIDAFGSNKKKKAIVLFSGGLDSTTCLYWALDQGYECEVLTVSYGQRHDREVLAAQLIARNLGVKHHLITLNLPWLATSSLVDKNQSIPDVAVESIAKAGVPSTYVPGRNLMFLSIAGSLLDSVGADAIIAGPNAIDFSGYPDCTPAFFKAAADALNRGTVRGVNEGVEVLAPLMRLSKAEIVKLASQLKVPFEQTWSCYAGGQKPCGHCDSCKLRAKGFEEAGVRDTALG